MLKKNYNLPSNFSISLLSSWFTEQNHFIVQFFDVLFSLNFGLV